MWYNHCNVGSAAFYTFVYSNPTTEVKEASFYSDKVNNKKCIDHGGK